MIHPGDVLYLRPDPTIPWISPHAPQNTPPGISTISYYDAVAEFSDAVAANDLDAARTVWERLSPDIHPAAQTVIAQALNENNWTLLRQMFP